MPRHPNSHGPGERPSIGKLPSTMMLVCWLFLVIASTPTVRATARESSSPSTTTTAATRTHTHNYNRDRAFVSRTYKSTGGWEPLPHHILRTNEDSPTNHNHHHHSSHRIRTACRFYVWNAPSALLYKWCRHLMRDCIFEGQGGVKFVRIQPGTMLQLLYPSYARYHPDSCIFCGGNFRDHALVATYRKGHLYQPWDLWLDTVYNTYHSAKRHNAHLQRQAHPTKKKKKSSPQPQEGSAAATTNGNNSNSRMVPWIPKPTPPRLVFHRLYVDDVESLAQQQQQQQQSPSEALGNSKLPGPKKGHQKKAASSDDTVEEWEWRQPFSFLPAYRVPAVPWPARDNGATTTTTTTTPNDTTTTENMSVPTQLALRFVRRQVLQAVDRLVILQALENVAAAAEAEKEPLF